MPDRKEGGEMSVEGQTGMQVILEHPATPDETLALSLAFAEYDIAARLRAAPRRRSGESDAWRVVISAPLQTVLEVLGGPGRSAPERLRGLVTRIADAWIQGPEGHVEVGARGTDRRATGGVLLTPDLPEEAYRQLGELASVTLDPERLFLWDTHAAGWRTFDADVPVAVGSSAESGADLRGEAPNGRFRRGG